MNLKERIAKTEKKFRDELSILSYYNHYIESVPEIFKIITELQSIVEMQKSNMLLAQHQILSNDSSSAQKTLFSAIEKANNLMSKNSSKIDK